MPAAPRARSGAQPPEPLRPQRPLAQAARDAARQVPVAGLGLDSAAVRLRMVQRLRGDGIACEPVLQALARVERHRFVDTALATQAYEDTSLPIGHGQTISKPSVVARMLALLHDSECARAQGTLGRVLEIGSGCGYQAALLSLLSRSVLSIERLRPLHEKARQHLHGWRQGDVRLIHGDGRLGHAPWAPYDHIVAAAGGEAIPEAWLEQLAVGGRLVAPMQDGRGGGQVLVVVDRTASGLREQRLGAVHFVPLKSGRE
ncbi:MAG: protein-L-isoaspartate O-methyltransferase [Rubrivivax sp. SCN 71-131]|jgi:protein-L-isoaspartate(D-aspartate) O-methyltransferase|nr:MAG: protein-L-isoaspartate O-methyltransferase [Rubrivivax sp. SCN 71-131]